MKIEDEVQTKSFQSEFHKAQVNIIFSAWWLKNKMLPFLRSHGLSHEQFNVMRIIRGQKNKAVCVKDITARMLERSSNTTRIIDKLEAKGLVARRPSPNDKRELHIVLTESGSALLKKMDQEWLAGEPVRTGLNEVEAGILNTLLDKLRDNE
ncbi:MAG: MarR family transcriptional regulator [Bacteroidetes bacterium]|nr:MarR family transcriptional regulator [Bacteroidota bacterium]